MKNLIKYVTLILSGALVASAIFFLTGHGPGRKSDVIEPVIAIGAEEAATSGDNKEILDDAYDVVEAIRDRKYSELARWVHPELGVYFTPYSTVELDVNMHFTSEQVKEFSNCTNTYVWGSVDGEGSPIYMTPSEYFNRYVYDEEYIEAPIIGINRIVRCGNSLENVDDVFQDAQFVELHFPGSEEIGGMDWRSIKLVFAKTEKGNRLVAIIHSEWTI